MKPKNPIFRVAHLDKNQPFDALYIEAPDELEALKEYFRIQTVNYGKNMAGETAKILPDGMAMIYIE